MDVDTPKRNVVDVLLEKTSNLWSQIGAAQVGHPASRSMLTAHEFQEELAILGLSGTRFEPEDYSDALGHYLGISIAIHVIPDDWYPELSRSLATSGRLGELRYSEKLNMAAVFVPGSLPPLVLSLTVLHELGHLAAGDLLIERDERPHEEEQEYSEETTFATARLRENKKLARGYPFAAEALREREANLRASYALFAGCLGKESPYVHDMHNVL